MLLTIKTQPTIEYGEPEPPVQSATVVSERWQDDPEFLALKEKLTPEQLDFEWPPYYARGGYVREYGVFVDSPEELSGMTEFGE